MSTDSKINLSITSNSWSKKKAVSLDSNTLKKTSSNQTPVAPTRQKGSNFNPLNYGAGLFGKAARVNSSESSTGIASQSDTKSKFEKDFSGDGPTVELAGSIKDLSATKPSDNDTLLKEPQRTKETDKKEVFA